MSVFDRFWKLFVRDAGDSAWYRVYGIKGSPLVDYIPKVNADGDLEFLPDIGVSSNAGNYLASGGEVVWVSGLTYQVGAAVYYIGNEQYSSGVQTVTLGAADPSLDRIDVIALNDQQQAVVVAGTPANPPAEPSTDPDTQLKLIIVYVPAGATTPQDVSVTDIYLENAEWTATASAGTINFDGTTTPYSGTKAIEGTSVAANSYMQFVKPASGTEDITTYDKLVLYVRIDTAWSKQKKLRLSWLFSGALRGSSISIANGQYGFDQQFTGSFGGTDVWQLVTIPISAFSIPSGTLVNTLKIEVIGGGSNVDFIMDVIQLQKGVPTAPPPPDAGIHKFDDLDDGSVTAPEAGDRLVYDGVNFVNRAVQGGFSVVCGDGSNGISTTGIVAAFQLPYDLNITEISLIAPNGAASCEFDIWTDSTLPTVADTIFSGTKPALASATTYTDTTLTGVTTALLAGNWVVVKLNSVSGGPAILGLTVKGTKGANS